MSLLKDTIRSLVETGAIKHTFTMKDHTFVMEVLNSEKQILADSLVDTEIIAGKYNAKGVGNFRDTIDKYRSLAQVAFAVTSVNGKPPVDLEAELSAQYTQRIEFRNELMELGVGVMDRLIQEYGNAVNKQRDFLKDEENAEK